MQEASSGQVAQQAATASAPDAGHLYVYAILSWDGLPALMQLAFQQAKPLTSLLQEKHSLSTMPD